MSAFDFAEKKPPLDDMVLIWCRACWVPARRKLGYWELRGGAFYGSVRWWAPMPDEPPRDHDSFAAATSDDAEFGSSEWRREMGLEIVPMNISDAKEFVAQHHRHHLPPVGALFAIGAAANGEIVGAAIVGRPVARGNDDGWTAEVTRMATNGTHNACSMLYRACWRAASAMGFKRLVTYTLETEPGSSLKGAGFRLLGTVPGRSWSCKSRPRVDRHPTQTKLRWECSSDIKESK